MSRFKSRKGNLRWLPSARTFTLCVGFSFLFGCRSTVPIYVWQPARFTCPHGARIAIGSVGGNNSISTQLEKALMMQRPTARGDLALITSTQLAEISPVRLASAAELSNDAIAIESARRAEADFLLQGEVLKADLNGSKQSSEVASAIYETASDFGERLLTSWRLIDVHSSRTVASAAITIDSARADSDYPDLLATVPNPTSRLISASARDAWRELAPSVQRDQVELMIPWLQLGAIPTRAGIVDAHKGRWDLAEQKWRIAVRRNPFNIAARHNLAIAQIAREDFSTARDMLASVPWPLSTRLPADTRFWMDQKLRQYHAAHGIGKPEDGWLFPDPPIASTAMHGQHLEFPISTAGQ